MDAPRPISAVVGSLALLAALSLLPETVQGARYSTPNFVVTAPNRAIAKQVAETAEVWRKRLAREWLGAEMKQWYKPCVVSVNVGRIGAGGATTFSFDRGHVFGWKMRVQGTLERILDSVIPHEVSHTVFACRFRRPLPRWADEGAASLVEHESEKRVHQMRLNQVIKTRQRIPLRKLLLMKEYPRDMQRTLVLYAEGYSLADFLVQRGGKRTYLKFLDDAYRNGWDRAIRQHYDIASVETLEKLWSGWVIAGSPRLNLPKGQQLASRETKTGETRGVTVRSQSPDEPKRSIPLPENKTELADASPVAPSPRRREHATSHPSRSSATLGRLRALKEGWVPVVRRTARKPNAHPSKARLLLESLSVQMRKSVVIANNAIQKPGFFDRPVSSFGGFPALRGRTGKASPAGRRHVPRDVDGTRLPHEVPVARIRIPLPCSGPFSP